MLSVDKNIMATRQRIAYGEERVGSGNYRKDYRGQQEPSEDPEGLGKLVWLGTQIDLNLHINTLKVENLLIKTN